MNSDKREDYYVGLDMGTGSLGGAVTDTQYHLLKVKGKDFWFVREYETAKSQLDRRPIESQKEGYSVIRQESD